jgi:hypothetical protein
VKPKFLIFAPAAFLIACVAPEGGSDAAGRAQRTTGRSPSDEEARRAYAELRYLLTCGDVDDCGELWRRQPYVSGVSQVECVTSRRRGELRCDFVAHETTGPHSWHLHQCAALVRSERGRWRMLSIIGQCFGMPSRER